MSSDPWADVLTRLQPAVTKASFDMYLRGTVLLSNEGEVWTIGARNALAMEWLEHRLRPVIEREVGDGAQVRFALIPPAGAAPPGEEPDTVPMVEAVREQRVSVSASGSAFCWDDFYIKVKLAFRKQALRKLRGVPLSVFLCLALHVDGEGVAHPGVKRICDETGYSQRAVIDALAFLDEEMHLLEKLPSDTGAVSRYRVNGYAWFGNCPAANVLEDR